MNSKLYPLMIFISSTVSFSLEGFRESSLVQSSTTSNQPLGFVVHTANILGIFDDPFEFDGDYGPEINHIRQQVFDLVVSKAALAKNLTNIQVEQLMSNEGAQQDIISYQNTLVTKAIQEDLNHGPTLSELVTPSLIELLMSKQKTISGFSQKNLVDILHFVIKYGDQNVFNFLRNNPPNLLALDKILRDNAARGNSDFNMPILGSSEKLQGKNSISLQENLMNAVFTHEVFNLTKSEESLRKAIDNLDTNFLKNFFNDATSNQELYVFCTPAGQVFFYWLYQSLNLNLISQHPGLIEQVNQVKSTFTRTLGNPIARAQILKTRLIEADSKVLFTQESDKYVPLALLENQLFLPIDKQNFKDGTLIFLRSDFWQPDYEIVPVDNYDGYTEGRLTLVLARQKSTNQLFLLAAGHGHSTKSEDGRYQIREIVKKLGELSLLKNEEIKLIIGIDANTKTINDVQMFRDLLEKLNLVGTSVGPTTIKKRMVSAQHAKIGKFAVDEEDYLIVRKDQFSCIQPTLGFSETKPDINNPLPNYNNQSDHYAVGAFIIEH